MTKCKFHPVLIAALVLWLITSGVAALDWHGISLRRILALGAMSTAVTLLGLALNSRRLTTVATRFVGRAIVRAPRQARWEGYGEGVADTLPHVPRRLEETTSDLGGR